METSRITPITEIEAELQTAHAEIDRLTNLVSDVQQRAAALDALIVAGEGIENPALFGERRNLADLEAFLQPSITANQQVLAELETLEHRARRKIKTLKEQLAYARERELPDIEARLASALATGDRQSEALVRRDHKRVTEKIDYVLQLLNEFGVAG